MIVTECFAGKNVFVFGFGSSGKASADSLTVGGAKVYIWDDNPKRRAEAQAMELTVTDPFLIDWTGMQALILSPGIPLHHPEPHPVVLKARNARVPIISDVDLLGRTHTAAKYIGVTGTNGKSSTTALIGHILSQTRHPVEVGGNIGVPALELNPLTADGFYVIEMSSYLNEITRSIPFDAAVLLNITPDHLDRHGGMEGYVAAKEMIFQNQQPGSIAVVGLDDSRSTRIFHRLKAAGLASVLGISANKEVKGGVYFHEGIFVDDAFGAQDIILDANDSASFAPHIHRQNICAAYAVCRHLGFSRLMIIEAIRTFSGLSHRQQCAGVVDDVRYINDSKATNMAATKEALLMYEDIYWILGGRPKGEPLSALADEFPKVRKAFLIGEAIDSFAPVLDSYNVPYVESGDLEQAVHDARRAALSEGISRPTVLFSPACASFDQFQNFVERGNVFCTLVEGLPGLHMKPQQQEKTNKKVLEIA